MNIEIKRLCPELIDDYIHFFDVTPHSEKPESEDCKCYCVWWCGEEQNNEVFEKYLSSKDKRREYAKSKIIERKIQGYLAYADNEVVGWCNANKKSVLYDCFCWRNFMGEVSQESTADKIKSIVCFTVSPKMRGKNIATKMLEQVCKDAAEEGFEYVEGYPNITFLNEAEGFMGPTTMYLKVGFYEAYQIEKKRVMQRRINY